jgi:hypothetical protein
MQKLGKYVYPDKTSFNETLDLAQDTLTKYAGMISNFDAAKKLGHSVTNPTSISGWIFKRFEDACAFGLLKKERGGLRATDLATEALDPFDKAKASEGKAKAVRKIQLVADAFDQWNGEIPDTTAFPNKLAQITGISWQEAQKNAEIVRKLFIELFPYLKPSAGLQTPIFGETSDRGGMSFQKKNIDQSQLTSVPTPFGEVKTTMGSVIVRDEDTLKIARALLDILEKQLKPSQPENQQQD